MDRVTAKDLSFAIAQLMPRIIQGVQLEFLVKRPVTQTQFLVLVAVHSQGRSPMSVLAGNMHVSMPTMSGIVDRLAKAGYIKRTEDPQDRRQVVVELAPKGKKMIGEFQAVVSRRWQEVLRSLDEKDIDVFHGIVSKLKMALQQQGKNDEK